MNRIGFIKEQGRFTVPIYYFKTLFITVSDPLQECPKNARRVPLNALQISKNQQLRP